MSTSPSNSLHHSTFTPLKLKNLKNIPHPITCYALNYLTHRVLLCTKEKVYLYDLLGTHIIRRKNYAKELSKLYEVDVEIKSADAMLMTNLWITLINKKSFLFFNDYLEITRIYTESPSPLFNVQVIQRTNDFLTIREDRKAIKFWKFELTDDVLPEKKGFDLHKDREGNNEKDSMNNYRERFSSTIDREQLAEKEKQLKEIGCTFEINVIAKRQINIPSNRFIIKLAFSEELRLLIVTTDNSEILLYSLFTGEPLQPLSFCTNLHEREAIVTPHVTIDQEILYYCDEKRIASYDLSTKEELFNVPHGLQSRIAYLHAERTSNNTGIYILTVDEKLHVYSQALKKSIWNFDMKYLESSSTKPLQRGGSQRLLRKNTSLGLSDNPHEQLKKDNAMKEMISKLKLHISTDLGTNGLVTLIISKPGMFMTFDVMSACKMLYTSQIPITKMEPTIPEEVPSSPSKLKASKESDLFVRLELNNHTVSEQCLTNPNDFVKPPFDLIALWRQGLHEPSSPSSRLSDEISAGAIREMHILHEEKMYIIVTKTSLYAVSWRCNRTISQQLTTSEVVSCIAINLNDDNPRFGNYYLVLGTKKGAIIIAEADFGLRTLNILKHMPKHDGVLTMKHLVDYNYLISIGIEGDIFLYSITKTEDPVRNSSNFFPTQQIHRLIWNSVTTAQFFSENEIIAGLDNGVIQYAKFSWKNETNLESKLYEFHASPVRLISLFKDSPRHFAACDDDSVVSFWNLGETTPLRVFRFSNPIISLFINKPTNEEHMDIYIASTKEIVKFDYDFGGIVVNVGKDYDVDWDEAIYSRSRNNIRTLRDYTDLENVLSKMENHLHTFKKANKDALILSGPIMARVYYDNPKYYSIRTLEADFFQYSFKDHSKITKKGEFLVLDPILNGFHERKVKGEPLVHTSNTKPSKKFKGTGSWQDLLGKTLHRYPYIKSCMAEKAKAKELQDMHRNIIQLLNATYTGEDNIQQIYDFLENQCQIKRSDIDEASLLRAKQLYFKKAHAPSTHRSNSPMPVPDEIVLSRVSSKDNLIPVSNGKVRLPALSLEKAKRNPSRSPLPTDEISTAKSTGKPKVLTARHFKNNSESFARKTATNFLNSPSPFMSPGSTFSNYGKSPTKTARVNEAGGFFITKQRDPGALLTARDASPYQPYSTSGFGLTANTNLKLDSKFSFSPSPTIPSVLGALNTARPGLNDDKLSIGQDENTIRSPFFVTTRRELNRDTFLAEVFPKKVYQGPSISSLFNSTNAHDTIKKPTKNFVALHSKGFQTSENVDLFNHVLRLLLKNHHILKADVLSDKPKVTKQSSSNSGSNDDDEDSVEYVPIEIKQFVLETSQKELEALDSVILMYEKHTGSRINTHENLPKSPEEGYNTLKLEEEMSKENEYLEQVLKRINDHGVESVSLNQMIKFKQIMKRRFEIFTRLQTHIEVSGLLRTKPLTSREVQLKEELKQTFRQIKKITALKPIFAFYEPIIKSSSQSGGSSPHKNPGSQSARTPNHARSDSFAQDNMLSSIKKSIETTKTLDRVVKAFRNDHGASSPIQESLLEAEGGKSNKAKGKKVPKKTRSYNSLTPHGDSAIKTWGDVMGFIESNISLKGADVEGGTDFERKSTLASIVYEAKRKRRTSFTETKENNKERQRVLLSRGEAKTVTTLTEGERKRRLEKLLAKPGGSVALPLETEEDDEEIKEERNRKRMEIKEIERAWREKDFEFLRTYLKAPTIRVNTQKDTSEEDDSVREKKMGEYERKKKNKNKKKKVNPNIRTNSGGVMTSVKSLRKSDSNSRDIVDDLSEDEPEGKSEVYSDDEDLIVEEDDDEDLFSPFFKKKEVKAPSLVKDKPEFHIDINGANKGKTMLSLTNRRSESRIMTKPSPRTPAPGGASDKIKIIAELKKQANTKITRKFAPSKKAATHETKLSLDKPLTPKGKRPSTRSELGGSISHGDSMGFSVWQQKAENTLDRLKNDTISIESKYGLENQQILEQTLEDKDKDKHKKLKEIVEDWKFIQDFKPPPLNLKRGSFKSPTQIKKEDNTNSEPGTATPVPRNYLMSPGTGKRASIFIANDGFRPKTDDKMTIKSFPSKNENGEDGASSRLKTEEQKKELNLSGLGKWSEGNRSPLNASKMSEKSVKNLSVNKSVEKSLVVAQTSPVHSPVARLEEKSTESPKKGNKTKIEKESSKQKPGKADKNDKDNKKQESGEHEGKGKGKGKSKEAEKPKEPEKKLLDIKKMNTQTVIAEEPELKLEEQKPVEELTVVKTNANLSRAEITSPTASPRLSASKLKESILVPKSPTHDKSRPIAEEEEEIVPSAEEIESPATASIGKVLEELPSPMKKPKRVKVIKKADLLPQEPEPDILLSKRRITRTSIRTDLDNKKPEDLLDDPIKLLNSVLKVQEVDHETKLDLFLYGNRKEALKDFVKEIEETIEHNVLKQEECGEQLDDFFDRKLNNMLTENSSSLFPRQQAANFDAHHLWKRSSTRLIKLEEDEGQNAIGNPFLRRAFREYEEERLRRQAFLHGPIIVNHLKSTDQRKVKVLKQGSMGTGEKDIRNGKVILSPDCLEIMLQNKGETLLERAEDQEEEDEYEESQRERRMQEKEEMELLERIERIRRFLRELKKRDPPHFRELVQSFYDNKKFYGFIMKDIEAKKEDRVLEPLNNDDAY